jgi:hypothetical protein
MEGSMAIMGCLVDVTEGPVYGNAGVPVGYINLTEGSMAMLGCPVGLLRKP